MGKGFPVGRGRIVNRFVIVEGPICEKISPDVRRAELLPVPLGFAVEDSEDGNRYKLKVRERRGATVNVVRSGAVSVWRSYRMVDRLRAESSLCLATEAGARELAGRLTAEFFAYGDEWAERFFGPWQNLGNPAQPVLVLPGR